MINQLLMAAARGARVQRRDWNGGYWELAYLSHLPYAATPYEYRIHPSDDHLRFGPVSAALREAAVEPPEKTEYFDPILRAYINRFKYSDEVYMWADTQTQALFLLLLSEALCDEGL